MNGGLQQSSSRQPAVLGTSGAVGSREEEVGMRERQQFEELSSAVALGLLAENMVLALGRVLRGDPVRDTDRPVLEDAKRLFETLGDDTIVPLNRMYDRMFADDAYRDTLRIVREQVPDQSDREIATQLAALIGSVLEGAVDEELRVRLASLREIFVEVGKTMLLRSNELMRSEQETISSWRPMQAISLSS
jgi:hypothetical protein